MFSLFKSKLIITAPVKGTICPLEEVNDPVFSQKMMGDGIAIIAEEETICAPCDGTITLIAETKHAFGITTKNGVEVLVHVGLDTVQLKGEGFVALQKAGTKVAQGTPILKVDLAMMKQRNISIVTPVIITNTNDHPCKDIHAGNVISAGDPLLEI